MEISISELREMWESLFLHLEKKGISNVMLDIDYYWNVSPEQRYNPYEEPKEMDLGQLSEDLKNLREMIEQDRIIGYSLVWLSTLTRAVGEKVIG